MNGKDHRNGSSYSSGYGCKAQSRGGIAGPQESVFTVSSIVNDMEEGGKPKKTIFVGGIGEDVDEKVILETFSTFGAPSQR
jgi:RNA recognition motif-containing protein